MEVNFHQDLIKLIRETRYLDRMGFSIPEIALNVALQVNPQTLKPPRNPLPLASLHRCMACGRSGPSCSDGAHPPGGRQGTDAAALHSWSGAMGRGGGAYAPRCVRLLHWETDLFGPHSPAPPPSPLLSYPQEDKFLAWLEGLNSMLTRYYEVRVCCVVLSCWGAGGVGVGWGEEGTLWRDAGTHAGAGCGLSHA